MGLLLPPVRLLQSQFRHMQLPPVYPRDKSVTAELGTSEPNEFSLLPVRGSAYVDVDTFIVSLTVARGGGECSAVAVM